MTHSWQRNSPFFKVGIILIFFSPSYDHNWTSGPKISVKCFFFSSPGVSPPEISLHAIVEAIPGVWASTYHDGIVWCNQLVTRLSSMMLQIASDLNRGRNVTCPDNGDHNPKSCPLIKGGDEGHVKAEEDPLEARNKLVMGYARNALVGNGKSLRQQLFQKSDGPDALTGGRALPLRLNDILNDPTRRKQCTGANLVWYLQYNSPRPVTKRLLQLKPSSIKVRDPDHFGYSRAVTAVVSGFISVLIPS